MPCAIGERNISLSCHFLLLLFGVSNQVQISAQKKEVDSEWKGENIYSQATLSNGPRIIVSSRRQWKSKVTDFTTRAFTQGISDKRTRWSKEDIISFYCTLDMLKWEVNSIRSHRSPMPCRPVNAQFVIELLPQLDFIISIRLPGAGETAPGN